MPISIPKCKQGQDMISETFLEALPEPLQIQAHALPDLEERVELFVQQGQTAWPDLHLSSTDFLGYVADLFRQSPPKQGLANWFIRLQAADLFLACGCAQGLAEALAAFEQQYATFLQHVVRSYNSPQHPEEDLLQILREKLFVETPSRPPKIRSYSGQGPLRSWLRITAVRTFLDCVRTGAQHKREHTDRDQEFLNAPDTQGDLEMEFLKHEYRAQFKEAFPEALEALDSSERNLLRQHFLSGLNIDQIGALYHIHRATAARRLAKAREALLRETRNALMKRLRISSTEFDSLMWLIQSRLEVSLHRLLQSSRISQQKPSPQDPT